MSLPPTGDKNQRYQVEYLDKATKEWKLFGWASNMEGVKVFRDSIKLNPSMIASKYIDRDNDAAFRTRGQDTGFRYEITYRCIHEDTSVVYGWAVTIGGAQKFAHSITLNPDMTEPLIRDRESPAELKAMGMLP